MCAVLIFLCVKKIPLFFNVTINCDITSLICSDHHCIHIFERGNDRLSSSADDLLHVFGSSYHNRSKHTMLQKLFINPECLLFLFICGCYSLFCQWFLFTAVSHEDGRLKIIILYLLPQSTVISLLPTAASALDGSSFSTIPSLDDDSSWDTSHSYSNHGVYPQKKNDILFFLLVAGLL